jgi:hypothetical protein
VQPVLPADAASRHLPALQVSNGARLPTFAYANDPRLPPEPLKLAPSPAGVPAAFITNPLADGNGGASVGAPGDFPTAGASLEQQQRVDWGPFWMGCWPFLAAELVTACYFFQVRRRCYYRVCSESSDYW